MKKIINFFKGIANLFDRYIIMPITRLIYKITKNINVPNKKFETWLSKSSTLLFISLFIAIFAFIAVDQKIISLSNQTGLKPGTHKVNIKYDLGKSKIDYSVNPSVANVTIYEKKSDMRTLAYDVLNSDKLSNTLVVNSVQLDTDEVTIRGAEYKIKQVATVKALIDVEDITNKSVGKQTLNDISLKAYDADGNIVDVEFVPEKVSAEIELSSPSKKVSLNFVPTGTMTRGKSIGGYTFSKNSIISY